MKKKTLPKDPWGNDYQYVRYPDGRFDIVSLGADGREGGESYDADITSAE
jgi:general secretion pathway protein G